LAANTAANYALLKQLIINKPRKQAEESFTAAAMVRAFIKQLQKPLKKVVEEAAY